MLKLPVCPYCHAIYKYREVQKSTKFKTAKCYHCKRVYKISYIPGRISILVVAGVLLMIFNVLILYTSKGINIFLMLIVTMLGIVAAVLLFPLTVFYQKINYSKKNKKSIKK